MHKYLLLLLLFTAKYSEAQKDFFVLMKNHQTIETFIEDSHITFEFSNGTWITGIITKILNDSFYFKQEIIHYYAMGTDTQYISGYKLALTDVYAMPRANASYNYTGDAIHPAYGRQSFIYVKNGLIFKLLGGGYIALNLFNNLTENDPPFAKNNIAPLGIAAVVYFIGVLLHSSYKPVLVLGKKYHLAYINMSKSDAKN